MHTYEKKGKREKLRLDRGQLENVGVIVGVLRFVGGVYVGFWVKNRGNIFFGLATV